MYYQNYEDYMRQVLGYPINDPNIYETYDYRNDYRNSQTYEDTYPYRNHVMNDTILTNMSDDEVKHCYPEIYHLVYPMVCRVCDANTQPITRDLIEKMTDEVYNSIENTSTVVNIRVDTPSMEENKTNRASTSPTSNSTTTNERRVSSSSMPKSEVRTGRTPVREESRLPRRDRSSAIKTEDTRTPKIREEKTVSTLEENNKSSVVENREVSTIGKENRQSNSNLRDLIKILLLFRLFGNRPGNPRPPRPPFPGGPGRPPFPGGPGPGRPPMGPGRPPIIQPRDYTDYLEF